MSNELHKLTIVEAAERLRKREVSSRELTKACFERIANVDSKIHAFLTLCEREALEQAEAADHRLTAGEAPAVCGIPFAIKDIFAMRGVRTTCASRARATRAPIAAEHSLAAGAISSASRGAGTSSLMSMRSASGPEIRPR